VISPAASLLRAFGEKQLKDCDFTGMLPLRRDAGADARRPYLACTAPPALTYRPRSSVLIGRCGGEKDAGDRIDQAGPVETFFRSHCWRFYASCSCFIYIYIYTVLLQCRMSFGLWSIFFDAVWSGAAGCSA
jgi:hypothetical protein